MLLYVPRMFTEKEFTELATALPPDFKSKTLEFWSYVEEKLHVFSGKIHRIYRDEVSQGGEEDLKYLFLADRENHLIVRKLVEEGAVLEATEDSALLAESKSWLEMAENEPLNIIYEELFRETLKERDRYISDRIDTSLADGELGVLFMYPERKIDLGDRIKIIKVYRFDPTDYLRACQVQLGSEK